MFGFNKNKRMIDGPIEFTAEVEIERPASHVFPLVDVSDPRFRHAQCGAVVKAVENTTDRFEMVAEEVEDAVFHFQIVERVVPNRLILEARIEPQLFALEKSIEETVIEPVGDDTCRVKLITKATFDADLTDEEVAGEIAIMSEAVTGELEKIKVLAEDGIEALKELQEAEMSFEIDFGDLDIDWDEIEPEQ